MKKLTPPDKKKVYIRTCEQADPEEYWAFYSEAEAKKDCCSDCKIITGTFHYQEWQESIKDKSSPVPFLKSLYLESPDKWELKTRDGRKARYIGDIMPDKLLFVYQSEEGKEYPGRYDQQGVYFECGGNDQLDIFMYRAASDGQKQEKVIWMNVYGTGDNTNYDSYNSEESAIKFRTPAAIKTVKAIIQEEENQ